MWWSWFWGSRREGIKINEIESWRGVIIEKGLDGPIILNDFKVYRVRITEYGVPIDYEGNVGRWRIYYVRCTRDEINNLQSHILKGWYAHFWKGDKIIVVYCDKLFEIKRYDKSTWHEAVEHGEAQGIPENELDFPTD